MTDTTTARTQFTEFTERDGQIPDGDLDEFWATLDTTSGSPRYLYFWLERA